MANTIDAHIHLIQKLPEIPSEFPVAQFFVEEEAKLYAPSVEGLTADLNAALVKQFLDVAVPQGKVVGEQDGMLNNGH